MQVLVVITQGQAPVPFTYEQLCAAAAQGQINPQAPASLDGGATWAPVWQVARLQPAAPMPAPAPVRPAGGGGFLRLIAPVDRAFSAVLAGYMGLGTGVAALFWLLLGAIRVPDQRSALVTPTLVSLVVMGATLGTAWYAQRTIRKNPGKHGMGRVGFAYVCSGLLLLSNVAAWIKS